VASCQDSLKCPHWRVASCGWSPVTVAALKRHSLAFRRYAVKPFLRLPSGCRDFAPNSGIERYGAARNGSLILGVCRREMGESRVKSPCCGQSVSRFRVPSAPPSNPPRNRGIFFAPGLLRHSSKPLRVAGVPVRFRRRARRRGGRWRRPSPPATFRGEVELRSGTLHSSSLDGPWTPL
jgi:hypothetical protein